MKLFEKREQITRKEFRTTFRKANPILPGTGQKLFSGVERLKMEEKLFGKKFDSSTSKEKFEKLIKEVGKEKLRAPIGPARETIDKKIRFLRKFGGI